MKVALRPWKVRPSVILLGVSLAAPQSVLLVSGPARAAESLYALCAREGDDDTVRPYAPDLREGTLKAFKRLFPDARSAPAEDELDTQANYRCMDGKLLVCFIGANLPCARMNPANRKKMGLNGSRRYWAAM